MKNISIVTPCYNEEENIQDLYSQVKEVIGSCGQYQYEHIFIDNCSTDRTVPILRAIAEKDKNVKVIVNARNYGHIKSPYYAMMQATGDAVILIVSDLQDPPTLIVDFIKKWEEGYKIVIGVKSKSEESTLMYSIRKLYYRTLNRLSEAELVENFTGFGLYDRQIMDILKRIEDPYPYFRGLVAEIGFERATIEFVQPIRKKGKTKNNFYNLFDMALLGMTSHSKVPLRLATLTGFVSAFISLVVGLAYFVYKLLNWNSFSVGIAPVVIGLFFFASVQLFFMGIIGEYIGSIYTQVRKRPLVIERERINFDK
jgi:glycosyltransferase involved in cell wall biosynthesis